MASKRTASWWLLRPHPLRRRLLRRFRHSCNRIRPIRNWNYATATWATFASWRRNWASSRLPRRFLPPFRMHPASCCSSGCCPPPAVRNLAALADAEINIEPISGYHQSVNRHLINDRLHQINKWSIHSNQFSRKNWIDLNFFFNFSFRDDQHIWM